MERKANPKRRGPGLHELEGWLVSPTRSVGFAGAG